MPTDRTTTLQTLERGLTTLTIVARSSEGVTVAEIAKALGVHRAIAYRIVATLAAHRMLARSSGGRLFLGAAIPAIAEQFMPQFKALAGPFLRELARSTQATAFVTLAEGGDCVAVMVEESDAQMLRVGYRLGSRHPLNQGAAGIAILAGRQARPDDPAEVQEARAKGYSITFGQLQTGAVGVAAPLSRDGMNVGPEMSIGVVAMADLDVDRAIARLWEAKAALVEVLNGREPGEQLDSSHRLIPV
jgi:DNA-binding IclR family transcriptional regulator